MALTDGMVFIIVAQALSFYLAQFNKTLLWRIVGAFSMIMVGLSAVVVEDTMASMVFGFVSIMVGFLLFIDNFT